MRFWGYRDRAAEEAVEEPGVTRAEVEAAYDKGRREERARHRSHPLLTLVVAVVALVGAAMMVLAAREGSFAAGGRVMDAEIAAASGQVQVASQDVSRSARTQLHQDTTGR